MIKSATSALSDTPFSAPTFLKLKAHILQLPDKKTSHVNLPHSPAEGGRYLLLGYIVFS